MRSAGGALLVTTSDHALLQSEWVMQFISDAPDDCDIAILLAPAGVVTMEFPHILHLIEGNQWDTIYHEHVYYFSLHAIEQIFARHRLAIHHVEQLPSQFAPASVLPVCAANIITTRCTALVLLKQSIGSRRYGVRLVRHGPGSALALLLSRRCLSAHSLTVSGCSGRRPSINAVRQVLMRTATPAPALEFARVQSPDTRLHARCR